MGVMNIIPGWKYISAGVGIAVLGIAIWLIVDAFIIGPRDLHEADRRAFQIAAQDLVSQMREHLTETDRYYVTLAFPGVRKGETSDGEIAYLIRDVLTDEPYDKHFHMPDGGVLDEVKDKSKAWLLGAAKPPGASELLESRGELDAVLLVEVSKKDQTAEEAIVELSANLIERKKESESDADEPFRETSFTAGGMVSYATLEAVSADDESEVSESSGFWSAVGWGWWRLLVAVVGAAAIPFAFLPMNDWVTQKRNNALGIAFIVVVVLVAMLPWLALFVTGNSEFAGSGFGYALGAVLALGCFIWTYQMHDAWSERL